uniref:Uncharacterized protein n=1 Tax=Pipistrellus kuhlii TaxID=59472 RepID=A0A7J7TPB5_PIPKU|nr:hypothetical protein mPipKuh1_009286 [Pipistrellus kuhlii]
MSQAPRRMLLAWGLQPRCPWRPSGQSSARNPGSSQENPATHLPGPEKGVLVRGTPFIADHPHGPKHQPPLVEEQGAGEMSHALAGVAQWVERRPVNRRVPVRFRSRARISVAGSSPAGGPQNVCRRQPIDVSLSHPCFSLSRPLSPILPKNQWENILG